MYHLTDDDIHITATQSIDQLELEIKKRAGTQEEVCGGVCPLYTHARFSWSSHPSTRSYINQIWQAARILPLLQRRHQLLVTLLLFNSVAAEALPLALDELVPGYVAVSFFPPRSRQDRTC